MTTVPQPSALTSGYTATYDAWNRLVKVVDGANTVAEYEYDGRNRRIIKSIYSGGSLDHKQRFYYNDEWQVFEVRKEVSGTEDTDPLEQYIWHPYFVDALLLRDYDADVDGTSVRHYYTHDANFNVTATVGDSGTVVERYHYTPYGDLAVLDADFSDDADGASDIANPVTFRGRRLDSETGLYYFRNRQFHAKLGQFVSRDPIGYADGNSLYIAAFVPNGTDPLGTVLIKGVEGSLKAKCGGTVYYNWSYGKQKPGCKGYIIQKVTVTCIRKKCRLLMDSREVVTKPATTHSRQGRTIARATTCCGQTGQMW